MKLSRGVAARKKKYLTKHGWDGKIKTLQLQGRNLEN